LDFGFVFVFVCALFALGAVESHTTPKAVVQRQEEAVQEVVESVAAIIIRMLNSDDAIV
jgi:hypothetical protein